MRDEKEKNLIKLAKNAIHVDAKHNQNWGIIEEFFKNIDQIMLL